MGVSYGKLLADNVRSSRVRIKLEQEPLAARMRALGFSAWRRQTVARVEQEQRRLTVDELLGLALALETSMAWLASPTPNESAVELPSGLNVSAEHVSGLVHGYKVRSMTWDGNKPALTSAPHPMSRQYADERAAREDEL